ncbi:hypothetical protein LP422_02980 [Janibacter limosus]|uniref:Uncharacterized protein n=1 Tax=Janibacter limosus TaxID=53458 RepID=A0AC61U5I3_9MICO|nr:hypothetical protein [Janibacter limosus]UUZ45239.1 hypothetical protein LP422_02980 [Janibacter limosus]
MRAELGHRVVGGLGVADGEVGLVVVPDHVQGHREDHLVDAGGVDRGRAGLRLPALEHLVERRGSLTLGAKLPVTDPQAVVPERAPMVVLVEQVLGELVRVQIDEHVRVLLGAGMGWSYLCTRDTYRQDCPF